jgi:hypothetical protein
MGGVPPSESQHKQFHSMAAGGEAQVDFEEPDRKK